MLYGLSHQKNGILLSMRTIQAGECYFLQKDTLSYSEPVLLLGYYEDAPTFMSAKKSHIRSIMVKRVLHSHGEGPSCIALDPHVSRRDIKIIRVPFDTRTT